MGVTLRIVTDLSTFVVTHTCATSVGLGKWWLVEQELHHKEQGK
jgi:hypothetical protein